jgi:hypothetical protein
LADVKCWVHKCESDGFKGHELAERQTPYEFPSEVVVCELHRGQLSEPGTEWMMANHSDGRHELYIGMALRELNEFLVVESPTTKRGYSADARKYSSADDNGFHIPIQVRQRGRDVLETITLVMSPDKLVEFAERFAHFARFDEQQ